MEIKPKTDLEKDLEQAMAAANQHYMQWQQDLGAINAFKYLLEKQKSPDEPKEDPKLEVK